MPLTDFTDHRRWQLTLVFMVTLFVGFLDRINITFALPLMAQEYGWNELQVQEYGSLLMGLFYAAYGLANIFLTPFAARLGTRRSLLVIVVLWSLFTALGAWVSQVIMLLLATRILLGLSEGVHVPMMAAATKTWFPPGERSRANSIVVSGIFMAVLLSPFVMVPMMSALGWRSGFHLLALVGLCVSFPLVYLFVYDRPESHPSITAAERDEIAAGLAEEAAAQASGQPWLEVLRSPLFLLFLAIGTCNNLIGLGLTSWIPTYFTTRRGIPFEEITWLVAGPYAVSMLGLVVWATVGDRHNVRGLVTGLGAIMAGLIFFFALRAETLVGVIALFSCGVFFLSSFQASEFALLQRIVPQDRFAPTAGFYNGCSAFIGGGLGPWLMSPIIGDGEGTWIVTVVALLTGCLLLAFYRRVRY